MARGAKKSSNTSSSDTLTIVAVHGAGLGHMLYMKPNSVIIEIAPAENDGRLHLGTPHVSSSNAI